MKIKPDSNKHDHKWTDLLKVGLFSILMSAPLISVGVKCGYVICNKNAYQSYSGSKQQEYLDIDVDDNDDLESGEHYYFHMKTYTVNTSIEESRNYYICTEVWNGNDYYTDMRIGIYADTNNVPYVFARRLSNLDSIVFSIRFDNSSIMNLSFVYDYDNFESQIAKNYPRLYYKGVNPNYTLDNVFTLAVNDIANNSLFNWTQNTAIYTGINTMTTNLEIVNPTIAILITYWTLLTIIYVIIDILLTGFIYLTHLIVRGN